MKHPRNSELLATEQAAVDPDPGSKRHKHTHQDASTNSNPPVGDQLGQHAAADIGHAAQLLIAAFAVARVHIMQQL
jgi:hypothetical protein